MPVVLLLEIFLSVPVVRLAAYGDSKLLVAPGNHRYADAPFDYPQAWIFHARQFRIGGETKSSPGGFKFVVRYCTPVR